MTEAKSERTSAEKDVILLYGYLLKSLKNIFICLPDFNFGFRVYHFVIGLTNPTFAPEYLF